MSTYFYDSHEQRNVLRFFRDLIRARELLLDLVRKDLRARYRYAVMGFLWALAEPLAFALILTFVFTFVFSSKPGIGAFQDPRPYPVMLLCGLVFWQFMAGALPTATHSIVTSFNLVKKVNFPREVIPIASLGYPLVNLGIGFLLLLGVHLVTGGAIHPGWVWFPVVFGIQFALALGLALLLSCGHVVFRDVGNMVNVGILFGFYGSPTFYPYSWVRDSEQLPWLVKTLYLANPMAGLLTAYREILFEGRFPQWTYLAWPTILAAACLVAGVYLFRKLAPTFSDYM